MDLIQQLDSRLFVMINSQVGRWPWLDAAARLFVNDYFVPTVLALLLLALWFEGTSLVSLTANRRAVLVGALSAGLANILLKAINILYDRPRPFEALEVNLLFYRPSDPSLPSNAAALGFSIAAGVWFYQRRWGGMLLAIAGLFAFSRMYGGGHYPLDILSGALLGLTSAWVIRRQGALIDVLLRLIIGLTETFRLVPEPASQRSFVSVCGNPKTVRNCHSTDEMKQG